MLLWFPNFWSVGIKFWGERLKVKFHRLTRCSQDNWLSGLYIYVHLIKPHFCQLWIVRDCCFQARKTAAKLWWQARIAGSRDMSRDSASQWRGGLTKSTLSRGRGGASASDPIRAEVTGRGKFPSNSRATLWVFLLLHFHPSLHNPPAVKKQFWKFPVVKSFPRWSAKDGRLVNGTVMEEDGRWLEPGLPRGQYLGEASRRVPRSPMTACQS